MGTPLLPRYSPHLSLLFTTHWLSFSFNRLREMSKVVCTATHVRKGDRPASRVYGSDMASPQTPNEIERRVVATWAAGCAELVMPLFEAEASADGRPRDAIA